MDYSAPHIRSLETVPKIFWKIVFALVPAVLFSVVVAPWETARILGASVSAAILAEAASKKIKKEESSLHDGTAVLTGLLFGLMCPPGISTGLVIGGSCFSVVAGKEIFGGAGQNPFQPAVLGQAFLHSGFPQKMISFMTFERMPGGWMDFYEKRAALNPKLYFFLELEPGMLGEVSAFALVLGGVFLIYKKIIYWEIPILYISVLWLSSRGMHMDPWPAVLSVSGIFTAIYLITDPVTTPLTRAGSRALAVLAALIVAAMRNVSAYFYVLPFCILLVNGLTPWIDARIKPKYARTLRS